MTVSLLHHLDSSSDQIEFYSATFSLCVFSLLLIIKTKAKIKPKKAQKWEAKLPYFLRLEIKIRALKYNFQLDGIRDSCLLTEDI